MELAGKYIPTMQEGIDQSLKILSNPRSTEAQQNQAMIDLAYHQDTINKLNKFYSQHYPSAKSIPSLPAEVLNRLPPINNTDW
jgi:hypothetical protein